MDNRRDLEERLIDFAIRIINVIEAFPNTKVANHIGGQLLPFGHFAGPRKIVLKEFRETLIWLSGKTTENRES